MINDRGAGFISRPEKKAWQPSGGKGDRQRNLTGQEADSWDVTEYVPHCHLGEALSKVTNVSYNRYHECVS